VEELQRSLSELGRGVEENARIIALGWERNNLVNARDKMHDPLAARSALM
jgi:hypothetical protein